MNTRSRSKTAQATRPLDYSLADIRRTLDEIRTKWRTDPARFDPRERVSDRDSVLTFCTRYLLNHHKKRFERRNRKK